MCLEEMCYKFTQREKKIKCTVIFLIFLYCLR